MARRTSAGLRLDIDGIEQMIAGLRYGADEIADVMREILRGPFGRDLLRDMKARTSDHKRSTYTLSRMRVHDDGRDGVQVGIRSDDKEQHPHSKRANAYSIGVWLESGTRPHLIPTKVSRFNKLNISGRIVSRVTHPGTRKVGIVSKTLRYSRGDLEREIVRELDRRLAHKMNMRRG